ncbi:MAG: ribonuclease III domain-containing protein [Clostridia bacterium]|nr:ribonuclease III domain-containing protein [Clostridia bacterium]MDD4375640.1 ribonuclease III domain-containing protein [Clostridia bacterium]
MEKELDIREYNIKTLAYLGDAVYELYVREHLVRNSREKASKLHVKSIKYVNASAQEYIIGKIYEALTNEEQNIYKRGRNAEAHTTPKNTDVISYKKATGFECIIGYLYITRQKRRLEDVIRESIRIIGERVD